MTAAAPVAAGVAPAAAAEVAPQLGEHAGEGVCRECGKKAAKTATRPGGCWLCVTCCRKQLQREGKVCCTSNPVHNLLPGQRRPAALPAQQDPSAGGPSGLTGSL